ncbi:asparagine--tRNA ligase [Mycoplasmoides genitalium]|uniref:asparagine--tRNA ligase n=1 Tax=Mycoplasmoides genitalium TaxID=2097 RepID=UPI00027B387D|nr:asparagine--tRNA ligase [Mycoplasmoides genitalium]AFQ03418.1 asparaginyl-tRNA ligase [Mycoplasmoides genitalium M6282]
MKSVTVKQLLQTPRKFNNKQIKLSGWVKNKRASANIIFLAISDGSSINTLQAVVKQEDNPQVFSLLQTVNLTSAVMVWGEIILTPKAKQPLELKLKQVSLLAQAESDYPLQKKEHSQEFFRSNAHLRVRAKTYFAVMKIRSVLSHAIFEYFFKNDFILVQSPILTSNDCEGAGETFVIKDSETFFNKTTFLTVSGQFGAEAFAQAFKKVFTFGPTFRAEKSHTNRHLSEFWMIEPEIAFANLKDLMQLIQNLIKFLIKKVMENASDELNVLAKQFSNDIISNLKTIISTKKFPIIEYSKALAILKESSDTKKTNFELNDFSFGIDLKTEHERFLCEQYFQNQPLFVINYPKELKAFYMKTNTDNKTVAAVDLLLPKIGEICGGSERESDLNQLKNRCQSLNIDTKSLNWYLDMRKWGYFASAGFGLGFDRLLAYICGLENIRDAIPFPRVHGTINF